MWFTIATASKLVDYDRPSTREIIDSSGFEGKVLFFFAEPARMSAGYLFAQQGIGF